MRRKTRRKRTKELSLDNTNLDLLQILFEKNESMFVQLAGLVRDKIANDEKQRDFYAKTQEANLQYFMDQQTFFYTKEKSYKKSVLRDRLVGFAVAVVLFLFGAYNFVVWSGHFNNFSLAVISERKKQYTALYTVFGQYFEAEENRVYEKVLFCRGLGLVVDSVQNLNISKGYSREADSVYGRLIEEYELDDRGYHDY